MLAHLGLADYQGPIPAPQTRRQSNDLNEAWVAAYLADRTSPSGALTRGNRSRLQRTWFCANSDSQYGIRKV